ncbi:MAG: hypothetical protein GY866_21250 [Proteobacteria bacterium]|nr:hypothetical protein [Pseudomonadota bacterium]
MGLSVDDPEGLLSRYRKKYPTDGLSLMGRKEKYMEFFTEIYHRFRMEMAEKILVSENAVEIIRRHTAWIDAWVRFTWTFAYEEVDLLVEELLHSSDQKLSYLKSSLPQKQRRKEELEGFLDSEEGGSIRMEPAERSYHINTLNEISREIDQLRQELETLEEIVPLISKTGVEETALLNSLLIFARGGYGREELTFSSDIDLGYCLDPSKASRLEFQTSQEIVKRMEDLFQGIPLDVASQYFELGENLSRFGKTAMLHTIPSILEGRCIIGQSQNLNRLKTQLMEVCPREKMIRYLQRQLDELEPQSNETFYIKEGYGGIRHLQYALWMVLIVINHECGNSQFILDFLKEYEWISDQDRINLLQALELYFDLRNFIGLYDCYSNRLKQIGSESLIVRKNAQKDFLDDQSCMAFLKLKHRFTTVDFMDRFRLYSIRAVAALSRSIVDDILDRTITEKLPGFFLYKHLGTNQIIQFQTVDRKPLSAWKFQVYPEEKEKSKNFVGKENFSDFFLNLNNLLELFKYIGKTGNQLSLSLKQSFSAIIPQLYEFVRLKSSVQIRNFIFELFIAENTAAVVGQMLEISAPLDREGRIRTLLGLFLPEVNEMRYLLRNTDIHDYPLCVHSLKALEQVEHEMDVIQKNEPELWRFISEQDVFALKWSVFFHDLGKINPYRNHEETGPVLSTKMLLRLGWGEESEILDLIRLLVANHQSVVRFSQLSTYLDLGILKFFELAQRDPGKVLLLYLINLSDFKSVNAEMNRRAAHLEMFFDKTMSILSEFKREQLAGSMTEIVNSYLDRKVIEIRTSVLLELLLRQCCNRSLEDVILHPLKKLSLEEARKLEKNRKELEDSLVFLKLAELDNASLDKHRFRFIRIIEQVISEKNVFSIIAPLSGYWEWFFTAVPNRYLLSSAIDVLTSQLLQFETGRQRKICFSHFKGESGEYDTILFCCSGDLKIQARIAYALSWRGVNIENGKINKVVYANQEEGLVGFFKVSQKSGKDELSNIDLETVIANLNIPPLNPPPISQKKESHIQLQFFQEPEKGYLVKEVDPERFSRITTDFVAVKISLFDAPFCYYKIMRSFEAIGIMPQQVTITTIGKQIIDYFYILPEEKDKLIREDFKSLLQKYLNAEISVS